MKIEIKKLTDESLLQEICSDMIGKESKISLESIYAMEHSPLRSQMFLIKMIGIPSFVSTHFVRHKIGVEHFVCSNREDRGGNPNADRNTPVNHTMLCNAQSIINMARERLCKTASLKTQNVMGEIRNKIFELDAALYVSMVPKCVYRGGRCYEKKSCGQIEHMWRRFGGEDKPTATVEKIWEIIMIKNTPYNLMYFAFVLIFISILNPSSCLAELSSKQPTVFTTDPHKWFAVLSLEELVEFERHIIVTELPSTEDNFTMRMNSIKILGDMIKKSRVIPSMDNPVPVFIVSYHGKNNEYLKVQRADNGVKFWILSRYINYGENKMLLHLHKPLAK